MTIWEFLATTNGIVALVLAAILIGVILYSVFKKGLRLKGKNGEVFQLGDDTPFEKTNARFKQLCADVGKTVSLTSQIGEQLGVLRGRVDQLNDDFKIHMEQDKETRLLLLRIIILDPNLPAEERIEAAEDYFKLGGNGPVKAYWTAHHEEIEKEAASHLEA